jgi:DNA-binding transcriptional LysR family regulator
MAEQKRTDIDWEDLRFFAALAKHQSLSATARALKVNHATVARRISALEETLGYSLFERRAGGYVLSDPGRSILDDAKAMEAASLSIRDRPALQDGPVGRVCLTTTRSLADIVLAPHLGELSAQFPGVRLEIVTDIRVQSLAQREADIALRLGHPKDSELTGRRVATITHAFYASQAVEQAVMRGETVPVIGYDTDSEGVAEARWLESRFDRAAFGIRSSSNAIQASAAAAGLGVAMLPRFVARQHQALAEIAYSKPMPDRELWMLSPSSLVNVPRVRAVWDGLAALFEAQRDVF